MNALIKRTVGLFLYMATITVWGQNINQSFHLPTHSIGPYMNVREDEKEVIGEMNGHLLVFERLHTPNQPVKLYRFNHHLQVMTEKIIHNNKGKERFCGIIRMGGYLFNITSSLSNQKKEGKNYQLGFQPIHSDNLKLVGEKKVIEKIPYSHTGTSPFFFWGISPDSNKIAVYSYRPLNNRSELKMTIRVMDRNLNTVWFKEALIDSVDHSFLKAGNGNLQLENNGNVMVKFIPDLSHLPQKSRTGNCFLYSFREGRRFAKYKLTSPSESFLYLHYFRELEDNTVYALGEYFSSGNNPIGSYFSKINLETDKVEETYTPSINVHLKGTHQDVGLHPNDFVLKDVLPSHDGGFIYIFEYSHSRSNLRLNRNHVYGDLLIRKVDRNGQVLYTSLVPKFQHGSGSNDLLSYVPICVRDTVYLIFNQNSGEKNEYFTSIAQVAPNGIVKEEYLFASDYHPLIPSTAHVFTNKLLVFARSEFKRKLSCPIILDFNRMDKKGKLVHTEHSTLHGTSHHAFHYNEIRNTHKFGNGNYEYLGTICTAGVDNLKTANGTASVYFPYVATNSAGTSTHQIASLSHHFSPTFLSMVGWGFEYQRGMYYGEGVFQIGNNWTSTVTNDIGYGNWYTGSGIRINLTKDNSFAFRVGYRFIYNHIYDQIGRIDNSQMTLTINNDNQFGPTYVAYHHTKYGTYTTVYDATYTQVDFEQFNYGAAITLGLEYVDSFNGIIYRLRGGYNQSFYTTNQITLAQTNSDHSGYFGNVDSYGLSNSFVNYHYSTNGFNNAPFSSNALFLNFEFVFYSATSTKTDNRRRW